MGHDNVYTCVASLRRGYVYGKGQTLRQWSQTLTVKVRRFVSYLERDDDGQLVQVFEAWN